MTPNEIKGHMKAKKLTQPKLAKRFGVSQTAIHFWIHGRLQSKNLERKFARALGVKVAHLRGEEEAA